MYTIKVHIEVLSALVHITAAGNCCRYCTIPVAVVVAELEVVVVVITVVVVVVAAMVSSSRRCGSVSESASEL